MTTAHDVRHNAPAGRYELDVDGRLVVLDYRRTGGVIVLTRVETPPPLRGRGLAGRLTRHALEAARGEGLRVVPHCPFVRAYIDKHPEFEDLVVTCP